MAQNGSLDSSPAFPYEPYTRVPNTPGRNGIAGISLELMVQLRTAYAVRKGLTPKEFHDLSPPCLKHIYSFLDMNSIFCFGKVCRQTQDSFALDTTDLCIQIRASCVIFIDSSHHCDKRDSSSVEDQLLSSEQAVLFSRLYLKGTIRDIPRFVDRCKKLQSLYLWFDVVPNTSRTVDSLEQVSRILASTTSRVSHFILRFVDCFTTVDLTSIFEALAGREPEEPKKKFGKKSRHAKRISLPVLTMTESQRARTRTKSRAGVAENELPTRNAGSPTRTRSAKADSLSVLSMEELSRSSSNRNRSGGLFSLTNDDDFVVERRPSSRIQRSRSGLAEGVVPALISHKPRRYWHSIRSIIVDCADLQNVSYDGHQLARFLTMFENLEDLCLFLPMDQTVFDILQRELNEKPMLLTTKLLRSSQHETREQIIPVEWIDHEHCLKDLKRAPIEQMIRWAAQQIHGADAVMRLLLFTHPAYSTEKMQFIRLLCAELQTCETDTERIRVGYMFKYMFEEFWFEYFAYNPDLFRDTHGCFELLATHSSSMVRSICQSLMRTMDAAFAEENRSEETKTHLASHAPRRLYSNLLTIPPEKIANYMTQSNKKYFERLRHSELLTQDYNVVQMVTNRYNSLQIMISYEILSEDNISKRASLIQHFIRVAQVLDEHNDLFSCSIAVNALDTTPVHRLRRTWERINYKKRSQLQRLKALFSPAKSYALLRARHADQQKVLMPHLAIYLQDFVFIGENRTFVDDEVNVAKFYLFCMHFTQFKIWQMGSREKQFSVEDDVANFLETARIRNGSWSEDDLWELSTQVEARTRNRS